MKLFKILALTAIPFLSMGQSTISQQAAICKALDRWQQQVQGTLVTSYFLP
jgi:hypothetical protein